MKPFNSVLTRRLKVANSSNLIKKTLIKKIFLIELMVDKRYYKNFLTSFYYDEHRLYHLNILYVLLEVHICTLCFI